MGRCPQLNLYATAVDCSEKCENPSKKYYYSGSEFQPVALFYDQQFVNWSCELINANDLCK